MIRQIRWRKPTFIWLTALYDQAADLLSRALANDPDNRAYRVKLIEVFFVWENKRGFLEQARLLRDSLGDSNDSDWNKVLILGKQLCPEEALFAGSAGRNPITDGMDLELSEGGETEIDFTLGDSDVEALDVDMQFSGDAAGSDDATVDFDFGSATSAGDNDEGFSLNLDDESDDQPSDTQSVDLGGLDEVELDFDLGSSDPESTMESPTLETSLVFDDESDDSAATMETPTLESPMNEATSRVANPRHTWCRRRNRRDAGAG